jgi:ABC-type oligopeptide transport system substrate-binding subunit
LFNYRRDLFSGNTALRQAVNWAIDRAALSAQRGPYAAAPWTHLLPPGFPGSVSASRLQPYSTRANLAKARRLARGHLRSGSVRIGYFASRPAAGEAVRQALIGLGFSAARIQMVDIGGFNYESVYSTDLVVPLAWCPDYVDPTVFLGAALAHDGEAYFQSPSETYRRKLGAVSRGRPGRARQGDLGKLDLEMTKKLAPVVPVWASNNLSFFGGRVSPRSLVYSPVYGWSLPAIRLK